MGPLGGLMGSWGTPDRPHPTIGNLGHQDVNPLGVSEKDAATVPNAAAAEAGRLRRSASAKLQNKVFDPGGG